jgi:hypothetical protein
MKNVLFALIGFSTALVSGVITSASVAIECDPAPFTCAKLASCAKCISSTPLDATSKTISVDLSGCKCRDTLSWLCCRGSNAGACISAPVCNQPESTGAGLKCQGMNGAD